MATHPSPPKKPRKLLKQATNVERLPSFEAPPPAATLASVISEAPDEEEETKKNEDLTSDQKKKKAKGKRALNLKEERLSGVRKYRIVHNRRKLILKKLDELKQIDPDHQILFLLTRPKHDAKKKNDPEKYMPLLAFATEAYTPSMLSSIAMTSKIEDLGKAVKRTRKRVEKQKNKDKEDEGAEAGDGDDEAASLEENEESPSNVSS